MHIINIQHHHHHNHVNHNTFYSPELIHLLRQFFAASEQRNEKLKALIEELQTGEAAEKHSKLAEELTTHSEETELDIEIVKKLLP